MRYFQVQGEFCPAHSFCSCNWRNFVSKKEAKKYADDLVEKIAEGKVTISLVEGENLDDFSPNYLATAYEVWVSKKGLIRKNYGKVQLFTNRMKLFY